MKIAIVGSGISGLYAAWKLAKQHQVTVYEKNNYLGGHTDTHELDIEGAKVSVDSGFIVFNDYNYPLFTDMLKNLGVETQSSDMSFSVNNLVSGLQYNPSKKRSLFARPQNFLNRKFLQMLSDLLRFYDDNKNIDVADSDPNLSIEDYLDLHKYSHEFRYEHLYPMCGALWSAPVEQVGQIPYRFVVSFFQHHRMLQLKERPQWQTVKHGSASYIHAIQQNCPSIEWKFTELKGVSRSQETVFIETTEGQAEYDWVIFASHADDSLSLIKDASSLEREILSQFSYQDNHMVVHRDTSIMPKSRLQWASWHVHVTPTSQVQSNESDIHYGFTYWMNNLQNLPCNTQVFSTLNPNMKIKAEDILVERQYRHPVFDTKAIQTQSRWQEINGQNRTSFCGAYWGWGFHEDGARSAARVVEQILHF
ncbi:dehydrogenase [Acinetobacter calcoaceticus]|uniref:NAD(P)/FAD-dependent oxidoreductase n=1 Tax=Acinetobacter calcoaceticus TaxID=471 RepID=UPI0009AD0077|nr:FAD-dependent oxidoreductase [Acinetobacter calcoaceticus]AQZ82386.1 dehydrogenase [Acinetobacter calcoaceticus]